MSLKKKAFYDIKQPFMILSDLPPSNRPLGGYIPVSVNTSAGVMRPGNKIHVA